MERKTLDGQPVYKEEAPIRDWWCVIETKGEEFVYEQYLQEGVGDGGKIGELWDEMINNAGQGLGLSWGEDDIYGYIRPDEMPPETGEEFIDGDNDKWVRVE